MALTARYILGRPGGVGHPRSVPKLPQTGGVVRRGGNILVLSDAHCSDAQSYIMDAVVSKYLISVCLLSVRIYIERQLILLVDMSNWKIINIWWDIVNGCYVVT